MYGTTSAALPATGGALLGLTFLGPLWTAVTLVCLGALIFGLVRLRLAEQS